MPVTTETTPGCYVLEFSVQPGGARLGDVHVHGELAEVRESIGEQYGFDFDSYLVMWYGAELRLWAFDQGSFVSAMDLHPYLRTGNPEWDRTLARVLEYKASNGTDGLDEPVWKDIDALLEPFVFDCADALPLLTRAFALRDRAVAGDAEALAEYRSLVEGVDQQPVPEPGAGDIRLNLDWEAIAAAAPRLSEPVLCEGWLTVEVPAELRAEHQDSYLAEFSPNRLHAGWNDLEGGSDEYHLEDDEDEDAE